jgi:cytochrome P450
MKPFTFADGQIIPQGEILASPIEAIHMDEKIYEHPELFDGFRFSRKRDQ